LRARTRQALSSLGAILRAPGAGWADVVRFSWYVPDASNVQVIRDVRDEVIRPPIDGRANPASTLVQVAALVRPEFLVEVESVVALPGSQAPGLS
jgi:enamine deaminase RidA (YjgF/YER057c/UK114 family)